MGKCLIRPTVKFPFSFFEFTQKRKVTIVQSRVFLSTAPTGIQAVGYASIGIRKAKRLYVKIRDEAECISS
jgi:hypothetical protein